MVEGVMVEGVMVEGVMVEGLDSSDVGLRFNGLFRLS